MKQIFVLCTILLLAVNLNGQEKTISGIIIDNYSFSRIEGVQIFLAPSDSIDTSNEKGKFKFKLSYNYFGTLKFVHPDYYPLYKKIVSGDNMHPQSIKLTPRKLVLDTVCQIAFKENKRIKGQVIDGNNDEPLDQAEIKMNGKELVAYSNSLGNFMVGVPMATKLITVSHPDFQTLIIKLKTKSKKQRFDIILKRVKFQEKDTLWRSYKNQVAVAVNELINGAIALRYQRYFWLKHAIGIQSSYYFRGRGPTFYSGTAEYKGIKIAPYYRFYVERKMTNSFFVEGKVIGGYFDFSKLIYAYSVDIRDYVSKSIEFSSFGFGMGIGFSRLLPRSKNGFISVSAGYQYFPMHVPSTMWSDRYGTVEVQNNWWYIMGPGSFFEFKLIFGAIF